MTHDPLLPTVKRVEDYERTLTPAQREKFAAKARDTVMQLKNLPKHDLLQIAFTVVSPGIVNVIAIMLCDGEEVGSIPVARLQWDDLKRAGRH